MKPARLQIDPATINASGKPEQTGQVFNIWYGKWTGGETNGRQLLVHAKTRCHVSRDSGYTRADRHVPAGTVNADKYFCLYFARGSCCNGKHCEYLHRIPGQLDSLPRTVDCFGREKFFDYREDMAGVGTFERVNKTLFVSKINTMEDNVEMRISKAFGEFGKIERIRVIKPKKIAFVTFQLESQAQFAKEAMYGQSLVDDDPAESLNIRWANEDPNPQAKRRDRRQAAENALQTAEKLVKSIENAQNGEEIHQPVVEEPAEEGAKETGKPLAIEPRKRSIISVDHLRALRKIRKVRGGRVEKTKKKVKGGLSGIMGYSSDED